MFDAGLEKHFLQVLRPEELLQYLYLLVFLCDRYLVLFSLLLVADYHLVVLILKLGELLVRAALLLVADR